VIPERTVERLSIYRRLLDALLAEGTQSVFSHELATMAGGTPAQVRRDIMSIGYTGTPTRGYDISGLIARIGEFLDAPEGQGVALAGVGHLGQAIMAYFAGRRPHLAIVAAFDKNPQKVDRVIHGCRCYPVEQMEQVVSEQRIRVGIIAVPATDAQAVASALVRAGVRGILNFAPTRLHLPLDVYVEDADIAVLLEKVAFFARHGTGVRTLVPERAESTGGDGGETDG
jgi:redox-sensing transcriptional repressor